MLVSSEGSKIRRNTVFLLLMLILCGCQPQVVRTHAPLADEGEVYIYLQPVTQGPERLTFTLSAISANRDDSEAPLSLTVAEFNKETTTQQRLIAHGRLVPGSYRGLMLSIKSALIKTENGEANLLVPEGSYPVSAPFVISKKKATVLFLTLDLQESLKGVSFAPALYPYVPAKTLLGLSGFVSNSGSDTVAVFDKKAGQVTDIIATGSTPMGMAIDRLLGRLYVALSGEDSVEVIDIASGERFGMIHLSTGDRPQEMALTPDGRTLLIVNNGTSTVSFADTSLLIESNRVPVGNSPGSVLIDSAGRRAYVFNTGSKTISVLDVKSKSVVVTFSAEGGPLRGQFNRRGDRLYVIYEWSPYLSIFDTTGLSRLSRVIVGMGALTLKVDPMTDFLYLGKRADRIVDIYGPFTSMPIGAITTEGSVGHMAIDGEQNILFLAFPEQGQVQALNNTSRRPVYTIDTGEMPRWVSVMGER
jgi:YVTN family beta-propeller protein